MSEWKIKKIKEKMKSIQIKNQMIKDRNYYKRFKYDNDYDILSMPDDIIALIGTFINSKEIIAVERINKIHKKQYEMVNRSTDDWIKHLKQYPLLYSIESIEEYKNKVRIKKLTLEVNQIEVNRLEVNRLEVISCDQVFNRDIVIDIDIIVDKDKFMTLLYKDDWVVNMHTIPERFISRIIKYSKPHPRYVGQTYIDMRGYLYVVRYTNDFDCISYFINKSYWPREGMKGCFRHVLIWENIFTNSMNIKLNEI
jgi:hypothetical protein